MSRAPPSRSPGSVGQAQPLCPQAFELKHIVSCTPRGAGVASPLRRQLQPVVGPLLGINHWSTIDLRELVWVGAFDDPGDRSDGIPVARGDRYPKEPVEPAEVADDLHVAPVQAE